MVYNFCLVTDLVKKKNSLASCPGEEKLSFMFLVLKKITTQGQLNISVNKN